MNVSKLSRLAFASLALLSASSVFAGEFKLVKEDETISLYERWVPGKDEPVREIKAVLFIDANVDDIIRLLKDAPKGKKWNGNASRYEVREHNFSSWTTYIRYDLPWPMDDQDCCLGYKVMESQPGSKITTIKFEERGSTACPLQKDVVRVAGTKGYWQIEEWSDGKLKIEYLITSDRSKKIPRWVSDPLVHKNVMQTLTSFKLQVERNNTTHSLTRSQ